jgi:hypothetical protein
MGRQSSFDYRPIYYKLMKAGHKKKIILFFILSLITTMCYAEKVKSTVVTSDSSNFVKASILVISPDKAIYSIFGHSAIRMQCPSKKLDYCFTFEMESGLEGYIKFFGGQAKARFVAVPTEEYFAGYKSEMRGIKQYTLNLTPHEKQELWRQLDNDMLEGAHRKFNLIQNNCSSMAMLMIESVLWQEEINFVKLPMQMNYVNGDLLRYYSREYPWAQFIFMTLFGSEADTFWNQENRMSPELLPEILNNAQIKNLQSGKSRPLVIGQSAIIPQKIYSSKSVITPILVFTLLLVFIILITTGERLWHWIRLPKITDCLLFTLQSIAGIILLYITLVTGLFGVHWNWYLILFNPIPIILWICCHKRKSYNKVYLWYTCILVAFIISMPFVTTQSDTAHLLIAATFAVRCFNMYNKK